MPNPLPVPDQNIFVANTDNQNAQSLANYLPNGELFRAKKILESDFRKLLNGLTKEFRRAELKLKEMVDEYDISKTVNLLEQWERALGIPDECFNTNGKSIDLRRKYAIAKLALMNIQTRKDFIDLAAYFGYNITIENGDIYSGFPLKLPILLTSSKKVARYTMIITFVDIDKFNVFPLTLPFQLGGDETSFLRCLFQKLKPAHIRLLFRYRNS